MEQLVGEFKKNTLIFGPTTFSLYSTQKYLAEELVIQKAQAFGQIKTNLL